MKIKTLKKSFLNFFLMQKTLAYASCFSSTHSNKYIYLFIEFKILSKLNKKHTSPCTGGMPNGSMKRLLPGILHPNSRFM